MLDTLQEVEKFIINYAAKFSFSDPFLADDLAQEARLAVYQYLKDCPSCPISHLINKAKRAIWHYRVRGRSVDSPLNPRRRQRTYQMVELKNCYFLAPTRPTETIAINQVTVLKIKQRLHSDRQREALTLWMQGWSWQDAAKQCRISHVTLIKSVKMALNY